ncbi:hypothetical protein BU15DRAFT_82021 [Melanogaster broomeanus]|nr:hypothetical protein BU15DRAFT_82021 [Melanogaster broomeanus]
MTSGTPSSLSSPDTEETFGLTLTQIANVLFETEECLTLHDHPVTQMPEECLACDAQGEAQTGLMMDNPIDPAQGEPVVNGSVLLYPILRNFSTSPGLLWSCTTLSTHLCSSGLPPFYLDVSLTALSS